MPPFQASGAALAASFALENRIGGAVSGELIFGKKTRLAFGLATPRRPPTDTSALEMRPSGAGTPEGRLGARSKANATFLVGPDEGVVGRKATVIDAAMGRLTMLLTVHISVD